MPTFEIDLPDGRQLEVDAPDEQSAINAADEFLLGDAQENPDPTKMSSAQREAALEKSLETIRQDTPEQLGIAKGVGEAVFTTTAAAADGFARTVENLGQITTDIAEWANVLPPGSGDAFSAINAENRSKRAQSSIEAGVAMFNDDGLAQQMEESWDRNADLGEIASMLAVNPATAGKTFMGSLLKGVTTGSVMGGLAPTRDVKAQERWQRRLDNASTGALFSVGAQAIPATLGAIWRGVTRPIGDALKRGAAEVQDLAKDRGIFITLGEAGDSGRSLGFEANVINDIKNDRMRSSVRALLEDTEEVIRGISRAAGREYRESFGRVKNNAEKTIKRLNGEKSAVWSDGMKEVDRLVDEAGGSVRTIPTILKAQLDELTNDVATAGLTDAKLGDKMMRWANEVSESINQGGAAPAQLNRWLKQVESASRGFGNIFDGAEDAGLQRVFMNKVRTALMQDIGENTVGNKKALDKLVSVRDDYRQLSDNVRKLEAETATAFLGNPVNAKQALGKLKELEPGQQREFVNFLRESADGEAVRRELAGQLLRDAVQSSSRTNTGSVFAGWDLGKFRQQLVAPTTPSEKSRTVISGLLSEAEETRVMQNLGFAQKLLNGQAASLGTGKLPVNMEDAAINVISQDPGFIARFAARIFSNSDAFSKMLFEPEANKHLRNLVRAGDERVFTGKNKTPVRNALIWLSAQQGQSTAELGVE